MALVAFKALALGMFDGPHATPPHASSGPVFLGIDNITTDGRIDLRDVRHISETDFTRWTRRVTPREGDLVFSYEAAIGRAALIPPGFRGCLGRRLALVRPNPAVVDARYLHYAFIGPRFQEYLRARTVHGSTVDRLSLIDFPDYEIELPSLRKQRATAGILSVLDDKIEVNQRMATVLDDLRQSHWNATFGLQAERATEGSATKLASLCTTQYGYTASGQSAATGPRMLRVMDINKRPWIDWNEVPHCQIAANELSSYALMPGDIVVARMADPGKCAIVDEKVDAVFASYLVRLKAATLPMAYFIYGFLRSRAFLEYAAAATGGSVQRNMNARVIVDCSIQVPRHDLVERHFELARPLRLRMTTAVRESRLLARLRDLLLPRLMNGEVALAEDERTGHSGT